MIEIEQIPLKSKPWRFSKPLRQEEALGCPGCGASQTTGGVQIEQASVSLMDPVGTSSTPCLAAGRCFCTTPGSFPSPLFSKAGAVWEGEI